MGSTAGLGSTTGSTRRPPLSLRLGHELEVRVRQAAEADGLAVNAWIAMVLRAEVESLGVPAVVDPDVAAAVARASVGNVLPSDYVARPAKNSRKAAQPCPHRVPAGAFCKRCEEGEQ